jgi:hypothetical protein
MNDKDTDSIDTEIDLLRGILTEVQDLNAQLARTDERSRQNSNDVETLREQRVAPLERQVDSNAARARRNALIIGAGLSVLTILFGGTVTYAFTLV